MKLLFFTGTHFADCSFPLIKAFEELGHDITTIMLLDPSRMHRTIININKQPANADLIPASEFPEMHVFANYVDLNKVLFINHPMRYRDIRTIPLALKVRRYVAKGNFDVVLSDNLFQYALTLLYFVKIPWISVVHDPIPHVGWDNFATKLKRFFAFKRSDKFILFNKAQSEDFCKKYKIEKKRLFFNKLSIYDVDRVLVKNEISVDENEVLFFGNIGKYKGIEYLCEAMKEVHNKLPKVHLTVAGSGKYHFDKSEYESLPYITFINRFIENEEMVELYSKAKIVVCPYIEATQSGVIMTAYAFNKPVIATRVGGLPEMVEDGITGMLVSPHDSDALARAITCIMSNEDSYFQMIQNIDKIYRNGEESWKFIANQYINIINSKV